ncbi:MAG: hypothetical protein FWF40_00230 [Methanomassiliicoccaceae archaeon]|nr:hypothetical protein [Methanomassiliicoccaceae archaeon]
MKLIDDILFDLSPRNGTLAGAILSFLCVLMVFVIAPYILFAFLSGGLPDIGIEFGIDTAEIIDGIWPWIMDMMKYAVPLILLSIPIGFYHAGSYARVPFKMLFALYMGAWLWIASHGGIFDMTLPGFEIFGSTSALTVGLDVKYIVYVMIMICFAMMFVALAELGGNRKKYLETLEKKKDTMSKRKARRLSSR